MAELSQKTKDALNGAATSTLTGLLNRRGFNNMFLHEVTPELIDDAQHSAPSKRIVAELPDYEDAKSVIGPQVAELIGLNVIRGKCPHFAAWLSRLEKLGGQSST